MRTKRMKQTKRTRRMRKTRRTRRVRKTRITKRTMKTRRMMAMKKMKMKTKVIDDDEDVLFYQLFDLAVGVQNAAARMAARPLPRSSH